MSEKLLVTQALDERDLLIKKIGDKIGNASFLDSVKPNEEKVLNAQQTRDEFAKKVSSAYQQIEDLITRFAKIDAAIVASNAATMIETSYGSFTVAAAISLRSRIKGIGSFGSEADFEGMLYKKLTGEYEDMVQRIDLKNRQLQSTAENMRLSILGKDSKVKNDKPLDVVDAYVKENTTELVDPLDIQKKAEQLKEKRDALLTELDTQIKVSNATTFVEID
ncbi:MAG: hypothetical protein IJ661_12195 [Lachnospiraceae bacterium]|nr:hypothetical protein [Lachnospiraceae bacterium]